MTDHELQLKAIALRRAGIFNREIHEIRERGKGLWFVLFVYFAYFAVQLPS